MLLPHSDHLPQPTQAVYWRTQISRARANDWQSKKKSAGFVWDFERRKPPMRIELLTAITGGSDGVLVSNHSKIPKFQKRQKDFWHFSEDFWHFTEIGPRRFIRKALR